MHARDLLVFVALLLTQRASVQADVYVAQRVIGYLDPSTSCNTDNLQDYTHIHVTGWTFDCSSSPMTLNKPAAFDQSCINKLNALRSASKVDIMLSVGTGMSISWSACLKADRDKIEALVRDSTLPWLTEGKEFKFNGIDFMLLPDLEVDGSMPGDQIFKDKDLSSLMMKLGDYYYFLHVAMKAPFQASFTISDADAVAPGATTQGSAAFAVINDNSAYLSYVVIMALETVRPRTNGLESTGFHDNCLRNHTKCTMGQPVRACGCRHGGFYGLLTSIGSRAFSYVKSVGYKMVLGLKTTCTASNTDCFNDTQGWNTSQWDTTLGLSASGVECLGGIASYPVPAKSVPFQPLMFGKPGFKKCITIPSTTLASPLLDVVVQHPDQRLGYYRGPRYAWSSMLGDVVVRKEDLSGKARFPHRNLNFTYQNPVDASSVSGMVAEFGCGRKDCPENGNLMWSKDRTEFMRIGVGQLRKAKDDSSYDPNGHYAQKSALMWDMATQSGGYNLTLSTSDLLEKTGYIYNVSYRVVGATLEAVHTLRNIGQTAITTPFHTATHIIPPLNHTAWAVMVNKASAAPAGGVEYKAIEDWQGEGKEGYTFKGETSSLPTSILSPYQIPVAEYTAALWKTNKESRNALYITKTIKSNGGCPAQKAEFFLETTKWEGKGYLVPHLVVYLPTIDAGKACSWTETTAFRIEFKRAKESKVSGAAVGMAVALVVISIAGIYAGHYFGDKKKQEEHQALDAAE